MYSFLFGDLDESGKDGRELVRTGNIILGGFGSKTLLRGYGGKLNEAPSTVPPKS
jgi:hypothetical protein